MRDEIIIEITWIRISRERNYNNETFTSHHRIRVYDTTQLTSAYNCLYKKNHEVYMLV